MKKTFSALVWLQDTAVTAIYRNTDFYKACQVEAEKEIETKKAQFRDKLGVMNIEKYSRITKDDCWITKLILESIKIF